MIRHFLTVAFRNIGKNLPHVIINVLGLGLAQAVCIVAFLNFQFDREFDRDQPHGEEIFRIEHTQLIGGTEKPFAATPAYLGQAAMADIPGIKRMVRFTSDLVGTFVKAGENEKYAVPYYSLVLFQNIFSRHQLNEMEWGNLYAVPSTFLQVSDPRLVSTIEQSLQRYIPDVNRVNTHQVNRYYLAPFTSMAHSGRLISGHPFQPGLHPAAVIPPIIAAIGILMIAWFNYTGSSIAFAGRRMKEIGIRKVAGSRLDQLVLQLMGEHLILMIISLFLALFFAHFLVPAYSSMWEFVELSLPSLNNSGLVLFTILIFLITMAGSIIYPSVYSGRINTLGILKNAFRLKGNGMLARTLLTVQFGITALVLFTWIVFLQNNSFQQHFDTGYEDDALYEVHGENNEARLLREAIRTQPGIEGTCLSMRAPFFNTMSVRTPETTIDAKLEFLSMDAFGTMGLRILQGRSFEEATRASDLAGSVMVNQAFIQSSALEDPVGTTLWVNDTISLTIVGVIADLMKEGTMTSVIDPVTYRLADDSQEAGTLIIRSDPAGRARLSRLLETEWERILPDAPFRGIEANVFTEASLVINRRILTIVTFLLLIAVLLSAAGLYAQVALRIAHRKREIALRKVFGSTVMQLISWLNHELMIMLSIGSVAGLAAGYFLTRALMDTIWEYYITLNPLTFLLPVVLIYLFFIIATGSMVYRAAAGKAAETLKYE